MKLAIFDFNGTIFPRETLPFLLSEWYKNKYSRLTLIKTFIPLLPLYLTYKFGKTSISKEKMEREAVSKFSKIFSGMSKEEISDFFSLAAESAFKSFNQKVVKKIYWAKKSGYKTVLLSGAFKLFLEKVGEKLGFDCVIGSELILNKGIYKNSGVRIISGSSKLKQLYQEYDSEKVNWAESWAYADSYHDLELLEAVGNPVPVNPDKKLLSTAEERSWQMIS